MDEESVVVAVGWEEKCIGVGVSKLLELVGLLVLEDLGFPVVVRVIGS